jgi:arabinofuranosyltransferase
MKKETKKTFKRWFQAPAWNPIVIVLISLLILTAFLIFEYHKTDGQLGAPLDDVFIHMQFSKNIAEGNGFAFNANDPTPGSTSPAWTLLITLPYLVIKNHLLITKLLSTVFYILSGISTYFLAKEILRSKKWALVASVFTLVTGRLAWSALSGMEVTLFTFLLNIALLFQIKKKSNILVAGILGLASTVRPEGYLLFAFYTIHSIIKSFRSFSSSRSDKSSINLINLIKMITLPVLVYLAIIVPYLVFSYKATGSILPNTFAAQSITDTSLMFKVKMAVLYLARYSYILVIDNPVVALLLPIGILALIKKKTKYLFLLIIVVGFPLIASITAPNLRHHARYTMPFIPLYTIIGISGLTWILHKRNRKRLRIRLNNLTVMLIICLMSLIQGILLINWADTFAWNVKNINDMHVKLGKWINENTPSDSLLAINDIGAITYYSDRKIIDMVGLVSPEVLNVLDGQTKDTREEPLWKYIKSQDADYLIILPCWYPNLAKKQELKEVYRVELDRYTMVDCEMVVYEVSE